jgi:hypothetical protein
VGVKVHKDVLIGQSGEYKIYLSEGSGGDVDVEENVLKKVSGTVKINVAKKSQKFATGEFTVNYDISQGSDAPINAEGSVALIGRLDLGKAGKYSLALLGGSGVELKVANSDLEWIKGSLHLEVGDPAALMEVKLTTEYYAGAEPSFNGTGEIKTVRDWDLFEKFGYQFKLMKGSFVAGEIANNDIVWMEGKVDLKMCKTPGTIEVSLDGKYTKDSNDFTGTGKCTVTDTIEIGGAGKFGFQIQPGSGLDIKLTQSRLDYVKGIMKGLVTWEGDFLAIDCMVVYTNAEGGALLDIEGKAKLLGEKKLAGPFGDNDYCFYLRPTEDYTAIVDVKKNEVITVGGSIAFKITDDVGELFNGYAKGTFTTADNNFTGGGGIYLGRDLTFSIGTKIDVLKGSGGDGNIENNKLLRLGGKIKANIYQGEEKLFYLSAEGEYNAVTNTVVRAEGHAELCKPWSVMGGKMIISNVKGDALVLENKLKRVHGQADVELPDWNVKGGVDVTWSNETGEDVYEGSGWLQVKLKEGKVDGKVDIKHFKYGGGPTTFEVEGRIKYQHNNYLGGELGLKINQDLDP